MLQLSRHGAGARPILSRLMPALLAFAATLLAGMAWTPVRAVTGWLESAALLAGVGIVLAAAAGLLACHLASLTAAPRLSTPASALPAALIAGALPGLGAAALLVPLALALDAAFRLRELRLPALGGIAGIAIALAAAWLLSPTAQLSGSLAMLAAAAWQLGRAAHPAGNDNRRTEPAAAFWSLPDSAGYARQAARTSSPVPGE